MENEKNISTITFSEYKNDLLNLFNEIDKLREKYKLEYLSIFDSEDHNNERRRTVCTYTGNCDESFSNTFNYEYLAGKMTKKND